MALSAIVRIGELAFTSGGVITWCACTAWSHIEMDFCTKWWRGFKRLSYIFKRSKEAIHKW